MVAAPGQQAAVAEQPQVMAAQPLGADAGPSSHQAGGATGGGGGRPKDDGDSGDGIDDDLQTRLNNLRKQ